MTSYLTSKNGSGGSDAPDASWVGPTQPDSTMPSSRKLSCLPVTLEYMGQNSNGQASARLLPAANRSGMQHSLLPQILVVNDDVDNALSYLGLG